MNDDIQKLISKYQQHYIENNQRIDNDCTEIVLLNSKTKLTKEEQKRYNWLQSDWESLTGQNSIYECVLRDLKNL